MQQLGRRLLLASLYLSTALAIQVYFDDDAATYPHTGQAAWDTQDCARCSAKPPNPALAFNGTWHGDSIIDSNSTATMVFNFTGTGVTVFGITPSNGSFTPDDQNMTFSVDGGHQNLSFFPASGSAYSFDVPFYTVNGLSNSNHLLSLSLNQNSFAMIDYFVVTIPDSPSSGPTPTLSVASLATCIAGTATTIEVANASLPPSAASGNFICPDPQPIEGSSISTSAQSKPILTSGQRIGLSVGLALGIAAMLIALFIFWRLIRSRRQHREAEMTEQTARPYSSSTNAHSSHTPSSRMESGFYLGTPHRSYPKEMERRQDLNYSPVHQRRHMDSGRRVVGSLTEPPSVVMSSVRGGLSSVPGDEIQDIPPEYTHL